MLKSRLSIVAVCSATLFAAVALPQDPPTRIARLNYISGSVSMQPGGLEDWTLAEINRPFTTGDRLYTDVGSRAEFHLDNAIVRAGEVTSFSFLSLTDQAVQLSLTSGDLYVNVQSLDVSQIFEVDSPNSAVSILRPGRYRFRIAGDGNLTFVVVRQGQTEITSGGQAINLTPGNSAAISGGAEPTYDVEPAPPPDDFDQWCEERDAREAQRQAARYLPRSVVGYEDLDEYGGWQTVDGYGTVWYPRAVAAGWAPYHSGHWAWIEPWGWTWVDEAPWGFAPFHYGRWAFIAGRWGWCPGPIVLVANRPAPPRPVYAPALVAWFGGAGFGVSIRVGGGAPSLGWVPLGVGEVYTPAYHCSPHYFSNVNVSNTTVVKTVNITNVYNTVYVNKTVYNQRFVNVQAPNAVTAMPQSAFASGRPVAQAGAAMAPQQVREFRPETAGVTAPPAVPTRQALMAGVSRPGNPVSRPSAQVIARTVLVHNAPAPTPAPFAARQVYLQQHAGEPHDFNTMHRQIAASQPAAAPRFVKVAAPGPATTPAPKPMAAHTPPPTEYAKPTPTHADSVPQPEPHRPAAAPAAAPERYPEREHGAEKQPEQPKTPATRAAPDAKEVKKEKKAEEKEKKDHP